ncbi:hypothetical protein K493DRAFT_360052 [Basidiobolus meristosporus CBS 931.73]|uniref:Arrestin C-terminal-like domain-containing protein n=1 Tax=Basidiobolus meristosporus CBS 931.73 TaxID=1314790 RepID=A0A1Y1XM81_9FUNG|nr:hypothetical protein K493DRAFT_360052 [Basidiobolus meristosporus CBS 931.73]|eukprot:ORX86859.1 hypothetical protein K493DRAFT_360052 [Basidiobolus meristosporus CBS 931.73]
MFSSSSLRIILQNDTLHNSAYGSEDLAEMTLRGSVVVSARSALKIRRIYLHFGGKLSIPCTLKKTRRNLVDQTITLVQHKRPNVYTGQRSIPFQILVPGNLPESFAGDPGKIKYCLKAVAETTFAMSDLKTEVPVYVQRSPYGIDGPSCEELVVERRLLNKLNCKISMATTDYTPGEKFDVQISMSAVESSIQVRNVTCTLKEFIQFHVPSDNNPDHLMQAKYMKILDSTNEQYAPGEHTKSTIVRIPESTNYSCVNELVEIYHELSVRTYFVTSEGVVDFACIDIPINTVSFSVTDGCDQLPLYHAIELPPAYQVVSSCVDSVASITPSPMYTSH